MESFGVRGSVLGNDIKAGTSVPADLGLQSGLELADIAERLDAVGYMLAGSTETSRISFLFLVAEDLRKFARSIEPSNVMREHGDL